MTHVPIKATLNNEIRRFAFVITDPVSSAELLQEVSKRFRLASAPILRYTDDEGELCTISCDDELIEALRVAAAAVPPVLRLHVSPAGQPALADVGVDELKGGESVASADAAPQSDVHPGHLHRYTRRRFPWNYGLVAWNGLSSRFVADLSIPDGTPVAPSTQLVKTWRIRNDGSTAWPATCGIVFIKGVMCTENRAVHVGAVEPGAEVDVSVELETPREAGRYWSCWRLSRECEAESFDPHDRLITPFGQRFWADFVVENSGCSRCARRSAVRASIEEMRDMLNACTENVIRALHLADSRVGASRMLEKHLEWTARCADQVIMPRVESVVNTITVALKPAPVVVGFPCYLPAHTRCADTLPAHLK